MKNRTTGSQNNSSIRLDKWLWYARFLKSRTLASHLCVAGRVRINRKRIDKAHSPIKIGDILTFPQAKRIRVVRVVSLGVRRGPAIEAATLYEDLEPPETQTPTQLIVEASGLHDPGKGRPTKYDRRALERLKGRYSVR